MHTISFVFSNTAASISGVATVIANSISFRVSFYLIAACLIVDLGRYFAARYRTGIRFLSAVTNDGVASLLVFLAVVAMLVAWTQFPSTCLSQLNGFIEENFLFAAKRLRSIGGACQVERGSVLLLSQAALPFVSLIVVAMNATYGTVNPKSFSSNSLRLRSPARVSSMRATVTILSCPLFFFLNNILAPNFDVVGVAKNRPIIPQDSVILFLAIVLIYLAPILAVREALFRSWREECQE